MKGLTRVYWLVCFNRSNLNLFCRASRHHFQSGFGFYRHLIYVHQRSLSAYHSIRCLFGAIQIDLLAVDILFRHLFGPLFLFWTWLNYLKTMLVNIDFFSEHELLDLGFIIVTLLFGAICVSLLFLFHYPTGFLEKCICTVESLM